MSSNARGCLRMLACGCLRMLSSRVDVFGCFLKGFIYFFTGQKCGSRVYVWMSSDAFRMPGSGKFARYSCRFGSMIGVLRDKPAVYTNPEKFTSLLKRDCPGLWMAVQISFSYVWMSSDAPWMSSDALAWGAFLPRNGFVQQFVLADRLRAR